VQGRTRCTVDGVEFVLEYPIKTLNVANDRESRPGL
jgi:hypothetical protein